MRKILFYILPVLATATTLAQSGTVMFPKDLVVEPFYANFLEPKVGFLFTSGDNNIRLDIGASRDFIHIKPFTETTIGFGADFFTYTRLRGEESFRFPVEAVDYLFGVNATWLQGTDKGAFGLRFRYSHISAHFVDGHSDSTVSPATTQAYWINNLRPHIYSREFFECTPFYQTPSSREYLGITYLLHVIPENKNKVIFNGGIEYFLRLFNGSINPFAAYDFRSVTFDKTSINNTVMAGIKFGEPYGPGFRVQYSYYNGYNIHGEFYNLHETTSSIGFTIDF